MTALNVENINTLIETLRKIEPRRFDMSMWAAEIGHGRDERGRDVRPAQLLHNCGTCACLGGWTNALFPQPGEKGGYWSGAAAARRALGLKDDALFYPSAPGGLPAWDRITRRQAIRVLEHLRDTGEVDWGKRGRR